MLDIVNNQHDHSHTAISEPPFLASAHFSDNKKHLLLAASGSVATIKIPSIATSLSSHTSLSIIVLLTSSASNFLRGQSPEQPHYSSLRQIPNVDGVFLDEEEWVLPWKRGNSILHIELRRWADVLLIAPLSANTLAKITGGFSDNLLTNVVRAWDTTGSLEARAAEGVQENTEALRKRILVAPAMNTAMWKHPITGRQIRVLEEEWGVKGGDEGGGWFEVLKPMEKELVCGDVGDGAMMDWKDIVKVVEERLGL
ncbi:phosphopantothenoylcysteine decarboxylase [Diplocarpon rosae]|nr:phosphopantothenoylcysteine decarboxylase [Diplocarpon rosae]